jgi:dCTP diphosphatase
VSNKKIKVLKESLMNDNDTRIKEIKSRVRRFVEERNWKKHHLPKNLSMSIAIESAELMEVFQWLTNEQSLALKKNKKKRAEIEDEIADVAIYLLSLCNVLGVDLTKAINNKMKKNAKKYPALIRQGKVFHKL